MRVPSRLVFIIFGLLFMGLALAPDRAFAADKPAAVPADHAEKMQKGLVLFKEYVRPVLIAKCLDCHGGKSKKADFDLSDRAPLVASGAIEGGGKGSQFYAVIAHTEEPHMPQKAPKLPDDTIEQIARWIELGAPYDKPLIEKAATVANKKTGPSADDRNFWSFRPLQVAPPPPVKSESWGCSPIDKFILAKLEQKSLAPNPPTDRRVLIRRAYLDLIGLPPTAEEIDAFIADPSPTLMTR